MADIEPSVIALDPAGKAIAWQWTPVTESDDCDPVKITEVDDLTLSVHGTMGSATITLRGSNHDPTVAAFLPMSDANATTPGTAISLTTTNTGMAVAEEAIWFKPIRTGGSSASITIVLGGK
jgi:hypothetical protein